MRTPSILAACAITIASQAIPRFGSLLTPRMELVYTSDGVETPWVIDSVTHDTTFGGRRGCVRIRIRTSPTQQTADTRAQCADAAMMYSWDTLTSSLRAIRPLRADTTAEFDLPGGRKARYETTRLTKDLIGGQVIDVLPTTVTTLDANGRAVSRLRERFAIALATATRGTFELPDMTAGGWRVTRSFELIAIRPPR